jgi:hypothetical protein
LSIAMSSCLTRATGPAPSRSTLNRKERAKRRKVVRDWSDVRIGKAAVCRGSGAYFESGIWRKIAYLLGVRTKE